MNALALEEILESAVNAAAVAVFVVGPTHVDFYFKIRFQYGGVDDLNQFCCVFEYKNKAQVLFLKQIPSSKN